MSEVLVAVERGPLIESIHRGDIAIVKANGEVISSVGDSEKVVYARSSMKPMQTIPIIETGAADRFHFDDGDLAIACASHNGEKQHTERVTSILSRLGLDVTDLKCGVHPPRWREAYEELLRSGEEVTPVHNNCSGKHIGMLATAKHMEERIEDYYTIDHPVQRRILSVISELTDVPTRNIQIGIDGCGVPVHGIPLQNLALGFARMADPSGMEAIKATIHPTGDGCNDECAGNGWRYIAFLYGFYEAYGWKDVRQGGSGRSLLCRGAESGHRDCG